MNIKDEFILNIRGHVENNTGYNEDYNSNYSIDSELELKIGNSICELGYKISINNIYDEYVELLINDDIKIELRPDEYKDIVSKNKVYGSNENFVIDKEVLFVCLKKVEIETIRHILEYKDYQVQIDENIKNIKFLLNYQYTYFDIQSELKIILFRLTDEKYLEKITNANNIAAIEERKKILPYLNIIRETIDNIDNFEKENKKIFESIIKKQFIDSRDFKVISKYLYNLAESSSSHDKIPFDSLEDFLDVILNNTKINSDYDYTLLHYYLIKIVSRHRYYFNHAYIAHRVSFNICYLSANLKKFSNLELCNMMLAAGDLFLMQYNRPDAMKCYKIASEKALKDKDLQNSAYALQKYYRINSQFPERLQQKVDVEQLVEIYKEYADIILSGMNYTCLKVDEVEFTDGFINNYKYVMMAVEEEIDKVGDLHIPYQRWNLMQKYYLEKYNIVWKNPKLMNPRVMFD